MENRADGEFNRVIFYKILPEITEAFLSLANELADGMSLMPYQDVFEQKARAMKSVITEYIDGQVECIMKIKL